MTSCGAAPVSFKLHILSVHLLPPQDSLIEVALENRTAPVQKSNKQNVSNETFLRFRK
jgi:hypothetical protein